MAAASGVSGKEGPDFFSFFTNELKDLLAGDELDDLLPFERPDSQDSGSGDVGFKKPDIFMFNDGIGAVLSDFKKERLKGLMKRSVSVLTQEVDQMVDVVLRTRQLQDHLRSNGTASSSPRSASGTDLFVNHSKKSSTSTSHSEMPVHDGRPDCNDIPEEDFIGRPKKFKSMKELLSRRDGSCVNCGTLKSSMCTSTPNDLKICNDCGLRLRNGTIESSSKRKKSQGIAGSPIKAAEVTVSPKEESCANCSTLETPRWRRKPVGARICNACGLRARKDSLSPEKKANQTIPGSASVLEVDGKDEELNDDLNFLLGNNRIHVEQATNKYADEISSSLGHMGKQLEGFLEIITSTCRNMTFFEKQRLGNLIKNLPPQNFDRVVEIIKRSRGLDQRDKDDIFVDLEDMDNTVLWRLYFYIKTVENARKLV